MGKLTEFSIFLQNSLNGSAVYTCGETISGSVIAVLSEEIELKALKISFRGKANVSWTETRSTGKSTYTVRYSSKEVYFDESVSVFGKGSGGSTENSTKLPAGQNTFPFSFLLPANLPSSFEGKHGHVRYSVKATIDRPWKFDHNTKIAFTVADLLDLNQQPTATNSVTNDASKSICCWCCASAPIEAQLHLERSGYVPGEFISVNGNINNHSSTKIIGSRAVLRQRVAYHATSPHSKTRIVRDSVAVVDGSGCRPRKAIAWNKEQLQIPPLPPSALRHCNIMDIQYHVQLVAVLPRLHRNLRVKVPIIIGSVPLLGVTPYNALPPPAADVVTVPEIPSSVVAPAMPLPGASTAPAPPPTYAAAVGKPVNIADDDDNKYLMGQTTYSPQYAYYDWSQSAFSYNK